MNCLTNTELEEISFPIKKELEIFEREYLHQFREENVFLAPVLDYIGTKGGKRLRPILFFLSQGLVGQPATDSVDLAVLIELLHTATLIHDDVVDGSPERRGNRTLNVLWGVRVSVLVGDYLLAKVLCLGAKAGQKGILEIVSRTVMEMGRGELRHVMEGKGKRISVEEYFQIIREKTAVLFGAACELGGMMSATPSERNKLRRFGESFGMGFQIRDDILDFSGCAECMGKPVGQDVVSGNVTLPLIFALDSASIQEEQSLCEKLKRGTEEDAQWIREFIERRGGIQKAQQEAEVFAEKALGILDTFEPSIYRDSLERLVTYDLVRVG